MMGVLDVATQPGRDACKYARRPASGKRPTNPLVRAAPATQGTLVPEPGSNDATNSSSMLDVPGHAEATIRLHKARIKSLEDDIAKLGKTLAGSCPQA